MPNHPSGTTRHGRPAARPANRRRWLQACTAAALGLHGLPVRAAAADAAARLTISTNNTPLDRKALNLLSDEAFSRLGLAVQLTSLPSERSLQAANEGEVDGEGLRIAGLEAQYPNLVQVPEPYLGISFVAFTRDASITLPRGWADVRQRRVAFIKGWKLFEAEAGGARVVNRVDRAEQLMRMLDSGHVDLALYTLADGVALARQLRLAGIVAVMPPLKDVDMYLYLHRRHAALVPRLARVLRDMKADGSHQRVMTAVTAD